jgi:uncharacterized protein
MLEPTTLLLVCSFMFAAAALYASVGHGGASLYIVILSTVGLASSELRPIALFLNVIVASGSALRFIKAGFFDRKLTWLLTMGGVPAAFMASQIHLDRHIFEPLLALALFVAALRYVVWPTWPSTQRVAAPKSALVVGVGAALGTLAGLTGIGGGVYLSPFLVYTGWAEPKRAAGIAACFILANSLSGLAGLSLKQDGLDPIFNLDVVLMALSVLCGGWLGAGLGANHLNPKRVLQALGLVLGVAAIGLVT